MLYRSVPRKVAFRQDRDGEHQLGGPSSMDDRSPQRVLTRRGRLQPVLRCWFPSARRGRLGPDGSRAETKAGHVLWHRKGHPQPVHSVPIPGVRAGPVPCRSRPHRLHRPQAKRRGSCLLPSASPSSALWRRSMSEGRNRSPWNPAHFLRRGSFHTVKAPSWSDGTVNCSTWTLMDITRVNTSAHFQ